MDAQKKRFSDRCRRTFVRALAAGAVLSTGASSFGGLIVLKAASVVVLKPVVTTPVVIVPVVVTPAVAVTLSPPGGTTYVPPGGTIIGPVIITGGTYTAPVAPPPAQ